MLEESLKDSGQFNGLPSSSSLPSSLSCEQSEVKKQSHDLLPWHQMSETDQLTLALELSQREQEEQMSQRLREEEELARIMKLSLLEK